MTSVKLTWLKLRGSSDQNIFVLWSNKIFVSVIRYSNETKLPLYTNINTEDNLQIIHAPIQLANWRAQTINPKKIWTDWKYFPFQNKLCIDIWKIFTAIWARKACCCWFVFCMLFIDKSGLVAICETCDWCWLYIILRDAAAVLFGSFSYFSESDTTTAACPRPCYTIYYFSDIPTVTP